MPAARPPKKKGGKFNAKRITIPKGKGGNFNAKRITIPKGKGGNFNAKRITIPKSARSADVMRKAAEKKW